jgi:hypothetical protein
MKPLQLLVVCLLLAGPAWAQDRPFLFNVTTGPSSSGFGPETRAWTAYYDAGYGERTTTPTGYDGVEQRFGVQGRLGKGITFLAHVALGTDQSTTRSSQQAEVLKELLGEGPGFRIAAGLGARREWEGTSTALARVCLGWSSRQSLISGNLRIERSFGQGRDAVDLITTLGWLRNAGHGLRVGVEAVAEDLEGLWDTEEAEGGAKLYAGPALHWGARSGRLWLSAGGGPIVYATRSGRTSPAPRPLDAAGNGFTMRASMGYTF